MIKLDAETWDRKSGTAEDYLGWVKKNVRAGNPVTIGVFMNQYKFYGDTSKTAGDSDYDHIVPVLRIDSKYDDDLYHADDVITFSDNGETACIGATDVHVCDDIEPQFTYSYTFGEFVGTRTEANEMTASLYTLPSVPYGISHKGVVDTNGETVPVSITTDTCFESPQI